MFDKHKERSLLKIAREQEAERLLAEQEYARYSATESHREERESEYIQDVLNVLGRAFFLLQFGVDPAIVGNARLEEKYKYEELTTPVLSIEYANLKFNPGKYGVTNIRDPISAKYLRSPFGGRQYRRNFSRAEREIVERYAPNVFQPSFEAVCLCSGCQDWGELGWYKKQYGTLQILKPVIADYGQVAQNLELFNEGSSGLALDCGTLPVFGLDPTNVRAAIGCPTLIESIKAENECRKPRAVKSSGKLATGSIVSAARGLRLRREGKRPLN
ncbi:MAG TPA: hypothetical protein VEH48_01925 [Candidatus Nitrosopolaris sp.]|nr:hypothetical protein [Candidatus Nitrosopolaris sp.]